MPTPQVQNDPIYAISFLYKSGLVLSNDATTPNTVLDISAGQCRDSNDNIDIVLGSAPLNGGTTAAPLLLNAAVNGVNGLDTGSLAASTMYAVYMIADSRYFQPVACILTLASNTQPLMPYQYDSYRLIGYWPSNASLHFTLGYVSGIGGVQTFTYDAPLATSVTAGAATTYTGVNLTNQVPPLNNLLLYIQSNFTANAAGDSLKLQGGASTGDAVTIVAPVAGSTAHTWTDSIVLSQLVTGAPTINYKVSSSSDAVALNIAGYTYGV